jgi:hypothetical protein
MMQHLQPDQSGEQVAIAQSRILRCYRRSLSEGDTNVARPSILHKFRGAKVPCALLPRTYGNGRRRTRRSAPATIRQFSKSSSASPINVSSAIPKCVRRAASAGSSTRGTLSSRYSRFKDVEQTGFQPARRSADPARARPIDRGARGDDRIEGAIRHSLHGRVGRVAGIDARTGNASAALMKLMTWVGLRKMRRGFVADGSGDFVSTREKPTHATVGGQPGHTFWKPRCVMSPRRFGRRMEPRLAWFDTYLVSRRALLAGGAKKVFGGRSCAYVV